MRYIDRDHSLTEEDDYRLNVEPLVEEGFMAERLYSWGEGDDLLNLPMSGWWIIPKDFYEELEREIARDEMEDLYGHHDP